MRWIIAVAMMATPALAAEKHCAPNEFAVFYRACPADIKKCSERRLGGYFSVTRCDAGEVRSMVDAEVAATPFPRDYGPTQFRCVKDYRCGVENGAPEWQ